MKAVVVAGTVLVIPVVHNNEGRNCYVAKRCWRYCFL